MSTGTRVPILPESGIYAEVEDAGAAQHFVHLFHLAWNQIPDPLRTLLLEDWWVGREQLHALCLKGSTGPTGIELPLYPSVTLSNEWCGRSAGSLGACHSGGGELSFHAGAFHLMPDRVAATVIAHELCHALFSAQGRQFDSDETEEQEVERSLRDWGFDVLALEEWLRTARAALRAAGVYRCGWCDERDVPEEQAPKLLGLSGWEDVCRECFAEEGGATPV